MTLELWQIAALAAGGFASGVINVMAGGGSLLTVPLLVMIGLPGTLANGTNRIGVLVQSIVGAWRFRAEGVSGFRDALPVITPLLMGSAVGAFAVSHIASATFERVFGVLMLVLLIPVLRAAGGNGGAPAEARAWAPATTFLVFFAIGLYGGSFQAGVGILLVMALAHAGHGLVLANSIKVVVIAAFTAIAVSIFVWKGQVVWAPAMVLAISTSFGAALGARIAVRGGEAVVRPVLAVATVALAGKMLGLY